MLLQIVAPVPAQALSMAESGKVQKSEGQRISDRSEVFTFNNTEKPKMSWFSKGTQSRYRARSASLTRTENLKITTEAFGLDEGEKEFNWKAFGDNQKFTAWVEVAYVGEKDESGRPLKHKVSEDIEISQAGTIETQVQVDAQKTVEKYYLRTEYQDSANAFKIKAFFEDAPPLSPQDSRNLTFTLGIYQIVSTEIKYNLIDEYGKAIDLNDAKEEKPGVDDLKGLGKIGKNISFDLKNTGEEILWQEQKLDEWSLMDSSLAMKLTKDKITSSGIDYKLSSTYDVLDGGTVTIQRQKDAVTPKDPRNPGDIPEGYARLNLSADALGGKTDGTFTKDNPQDTQRVVDVKAGKPYTTAQAEVDKVTKPFPLTSKKKVDTGKTFDKWTPALSELGTAVAKETKNLNASYKSSDVEIIPYLPGEEVPTKDKDGLPIPTDYVTVTFKSESATKGKVKIGDKEGETVLAKVKPGIDLSKKAEITTVPAENYGFTEWKPVLGKAAEGQTYTAHFVKSGDKINEGDPIPKGWLKVTVSQDESIVDNTVEKAIYTVKSGDKLGQDKFKDLKGKAKDGYKDPAWYVGSEKLEKPYEKVITTSTDFLASATEEIANKFKTNPLKAVDITAYKGDKIEGKFWNKGVTTQREDAVLERLIESATVTDTTATKRTTDEAGTFPGTLKVTFEDGSSLEVQNQKLIVIDTKVDIDYDKDSDKDANAPRHKDEVVKGKIKSDEALEGAKVEILDKDNNVIGITLAKADGSFIAGTRELQAGETIKVRVTLPKADKPSPAVKKVVGLNPDELNSILPTADKVVENLKDKKGVDQTKVATLEEAIKEAYTLVNKAGKGQEQKDQKAKATTPSKDEQDNLDNAYKAIKAAIKDLTENKIPEIKAPAYQEIFVNDDINLDDGVKVTDDNIKQVNGKDYSYKIYDGSDKETTVENMKANAGTYRVVYKAEDTQGVTAEHTMTVVVKKTVVEVPGEFPEKTPEGYVKVEFKSGEHAGLNGVSKFLVQKGAQKSVVTEPKIIPKEGYKVAEPKWSKEIPATFADNFETTAQVLAKVTTTEPDAKDKAKYAKLTFVKGDHGEFAENAKTSIYVLKNEKVSFNAPKVKANDGFTFADWNPELKDSYTEDTKHTAQYASNSDISDTEVKDFQEVKFVSGTDGKFEGDKTEKSVWVRPGKLVDLRTKAPKVTVTTKGKSFIGWDQDLVQTFTKEKTATVINAKYDDTVKTTEPKENKEKYAKVDFSAGNLGTIADDATKTYWVVKDAEVKLTPPTVTANKGWKVNAEKPWDPAVANKYTEDTIHVAQYEYAGASVIPQEPGEDKPVVPENFVKVEFKKGDHGVISSEETTVYWVDPTKEVKLTAPKVIADTNYKHDGWKNGDAVVDLTKANKFDKATDIVAQYKSTVVTEDPKDANYVTVEFDAKNHGTLEGTSKFWVYKNEKVSITAPKVTAKAGYTFDKWDPAVKDSYAEATVHNATYTTNNNVSDTPVEGYYKVTFKAGDHGTLSEEKSVWVKPDTLVDLTDKAPAVTPEKGYSHIGWKPALIGKFKNNTDIVAQYSNSISDKPVEGWTELTFDQGDHGKFAKGAKNVKWVNPKVDLKLKDIAPEIVADTNYSFDGWKDGENKADLEKAQKFETAKTFTATYKSNVLGKDEYEKLPKDEKKNFVQITFDKGANGKFPKEAATESYVKKDVVVDLTEKAPTVIPNQGYGHSGWEPALKGTFSAATTITAQYKEGTFDENAIKEIIVVGPTKMGYGEGEKLDLTGLKVIAKDDAGLQKIYEGVEAITKAGFKIEPAEKTELKMADNGKHIVVTKGEGNDKVTGQTETTLTIHENKSAKAEDVKALNQNKVVDGKVTNEPKDTTTVTGKVKPGSTVVIKDESGKNITPKDGVKIENDGTFKAEVEKQNEGKKVQVIVTEEGKQPSEPADATVARDANNDGKADGDADQRTATPTAKALNQGEDPKVTTITGKAEKGATVIAKVDGKEVGRATADAQTGEYKIEAKKDGAALGENTDVKVTAQVDGKLESEPATAKVKVDKDGNGVADNEEDFDIKKVTKVEVLQDPTKMDYLVGSKDGKTKFQTSGLVVKLTDSRGKEVKYTADELKGMDGITIEPADQAEIGLDKNGTKLKVTVTGSEQAEKPTAESKGNITVKVDADGNGIADEDEKSEQPKDVKALNQNKVDPETGKVTNEPKDTTTVTGKAKPGSTVIIKNEAGEEIGKVEKVGDDGTFTAEVKKQNDGDKVKVVVTEPGKQPSDPVEKTVVRDSDNDGEDDKKAGQTERPAAIASNKGKTPTFTTIKGKTEKGATITVTVKVNGEEKPVTVDNLKVNDDGTYTLEAKYNGKPLDNGAEILVYATNAPKTKSAPQTTTVFNDFNKDGKPDGGMVDLKDVKDIQVIAPNKMSYTEGDKLNGTGLKAVIRDNKGGIEIFDYDNATGTFKNADGNEIKDITATVNGKAIKNLALTEKDHNGKAIDVKVGDKTGSTNQTLEVKQLQTPTPSIEFAANQNTVGSDGKTPTGTAKQKTTVKFTVKNKPTTVYVKYTVNDEAKEESFEIGADGELTKTVDLAVKLPVGAEVKVLAKDADKTLSEAATAKVVRDANNDGTADDKTPVGKTEIDPIKAQSESITVKPADNATELVIKETDKSGNTPEGSKEITVKKDSNGNWTIDGKPVEKTDDGKLVIPTKDKLKLDEYNVVEVDAKGDPDTTTPSTARETVGQAADITAPDKPVVDQPVDGDKNIKVKTPTDKDAKTITVEVEVPAKPGEQPTKKTVVVEKGDDGKWKTTDGKEVPEENGKLVIPVDPAVKKGDTVVVEVKDDSGNASKSDPQTVVERETLPVPTIDPIKSGGKTVSGKAEKAATVDIYKKDGNDYKLIKEDVGVSADGSYTYNHTDGFKDGDVIRVVAKKPGMTSSNAEATVGVDTSALDKAITDGKGELDKRKDGTPADKALEDAIKEGEELKKRDPAPSQEEVDKAKDKIEKAIGEKKAYDEAKDKLKEKIKEAEAKKQDPEYPTKPDYAKKELEESATEGTNVDNDKTSSKESIDKAIEKIQEKLDQYNKQQIGVNINKVTSSEKTIEVVVTAPNAKVEVFKSEIDWSTYKEKLTPVGEATDITRLLVVSLKEPLPKGTNLVIKVTHPDYLSYESTLTVE